MSGVQEVIERRRVVEVARTWLGTPYHHMGRVKGVGVDCLTLLAEVYHEAGVVGPVPVDFYPKDFMLHREAERYLDGLLGYAREVQGPPMPGDIALWRFGRCFSHGAIVVAWPKIIHAELGTVCNVGDAGADQRLLYVGENTADRGQPRQRRFFSPWGRT